jgi:hypothetical protein
LLDRLSRVLDRDDTILFVCGYSFSDDHINAIIFDALEAKRRPHVIALQYSDPEPGSILADRASRFLNLMVLGPAFGFIGGRRGEWKLEDLRGSEPIERAFSPEAGGEGRATGKGTLLLGDFAKFAEFLGTLTTPA